ncbi:hypothetical protein LA345_38965 (plasmid) [Burkholderia vietnamiensis]|uniref:Uncharacterized protein n=1 Tax=Burkholderia vietnamiensis (strain G4 / LMG 22486) TaxID=269482 RepID=A4JWF3_BURVG|nr:hypothetical protein Bcep1808_7736 [Burkholderia vietnamiensis G4]MCB4349781.1 hypothetical protein [Burkholderia vietnamiensis]
METPNEETKATAKAAPSKKAATAKPAFPREMTLVNETAMPYVVARTHVAPGESKPVTVANEDELARHETDIAHLLFLNDSYKDAEVKPLRIVDAD